MIGYFLFALFLFFAYLIGVSRASRPPLKTRANLNLKDISVLIPYRNEVESLPHLLTCISKLKDFPKEFIFVSDHSNDGSEALRAPKDLPCRFQWVKLEANETGKKKALQKAIELSTGDYLLSWDADITVNPAYFTNLAQEKACDLLILPVQMQSSKIWGQFFLLDYYYLPAIHWALSGFGLNLTCSGANLLFRKEAYLQVRTHETYEHIASGDDLFLLHDFSKKHLLIESTNKKNLCVKTSLPPTLKQTFHQRLRWIGKSKSAATPLSALTGLIGLLYHFTPWLLAVLNKDFFYLIALKLAIDTLVFLPYLRGLKKSTVLVLFLPIFSFLYPFYVLLIAILALTIKPIWKGRSI